MDMDRYGKLYLEEIRLRSIYFNTNDIELKKETKKQLDVVVAEMVEIETKLEAEWFASPASKANKEDKVQ